MKLSSQSANNNLSETVPSNRVNSSMSSHSIQLHPQSPTVYTEERPWGRFEQFTHDEPTTVKIITVAPEQILSYQLHNHRSEFWQVVNGDGYVVIDGIRTEAKAGDRFFIPVRTKHRVGSKNGMSFLEIAFGHFDEQDIVRFDDTYGRT